MVGVGRVNGFKESSTNITFVEGYVSEKKSYSSSRGPTHYYLTCNKQEFKADAKNWGKINEGSEYRLWYSPINRVVVAYELLKYKPKSISYQQREQGIDQLKLNPRKYIKEALHRGLQGPVLRSELKWNQGLPNNYLLPDTLFYAFEVPILDNGTHIALRAVSVKLDKAGKKVLEDQPKIDKLVQRLVSGLNKILDDEKKYDEVYAIVKNWPILVALGGETVSLLVTAAQESEDITTQVLISQLLGSIARDTSIQLSRQFPDLLCQYCFVRCAAHEIEVSWKMDSSRLFTSFTYYGCRICGQSRKFLPHTGSIVAVLNDQMEKHYVRADEVLKVNWFIQRNVFDFDKVEIVQADDEAVERFAVQVGNDTDEVRRPRYKRMPCVVSASCNLSPNSIRILQRVFGQVSIE